MLGIHVRLLALKKEVAADTPDCHREIATTQRLVEESLKDHQSIRPEFGIQHESKRTELSRLYHAALKKHLAARPPRSTWGLRVNWDTCLKRGLETLDLAQNHEIALVSLVLPGYSSSTSDGLMGRAGMFFAEAITPIEQTHRGAREANIHLNQIDRNAEPAHGELADSIEELKQEIVQRKVVEDSLRVSEQTSSKLLEKSRQMQEELRHLSRQLLSAQEEERKKISRELHDVIAQTLTGINVRLAALKVRVHRQRD